MIRWNEDLKKAPIGKPFLLQVNHGLFSGGWQFHKALRIGDTFFNFETKEVIEDPDSWAEVTL